MRLNCLCTAACNISVNILAKVPKGKCTLVVADNREPERGVDVEVIWIEEKRVVPRVDSAEGEKRVVYRLIQ